MRSRFANLVAVFFVIALVSCRETPADSAIIRKIETSTSVNSALNPAEHDSIHIIDMNENTPWCSSEENPSISITLDKPIEFNFIHLDNGLKKNPNASARIKKIAMHVFTAGKDKGKALQISVPDKPRVGLTLEKKVYGNRIEIQISEKYTGGRKKDSAAITCLGALGFGKREKEGKPQLLPFLYKQGEKTFTVTEFYDQFLKEKFNYLNNNLKIAGCVMGTECSSKRVRIYHLDKGSVKFGFQWEIKDDEIKISTPMYYIQPADSALKYIPLELVPLGHTEDGIMFQAVDSSDKSPVASVNMQWQKSKGISDAREMLKDEDLEYNNIESAEIIVIKFKPERFDEDSIATYIVQ